MFDWLIANTDKCVLHLRTGDTGVDKDFAIPAREHSYVSTGAFQNANVAAELVDVDLCRSSGITDYDNGTLHSGYGTKLAFEKREQLGIDDGRLRCDHAVRVVLVCLQRPVLEKLG